MKYTVITGASSGIGYEAALVFAKKGKNLILVARRQEKLAELSQKIIQENPQVDVVIKISDLTHTDEVYQLYNELRAFEIDTWINNAGLGDSALIRNEELAKIETILKLNVEALTILSTLYVKDYFDQEGAQLINVSSAMGYRIALGSVVYSASKYYVSAFTEGLSAELTNYNLTAKVLAPAVTETEFINKATGRQAFDYQANMSQFHTAKEMAGFLVALYESDQTVGIVNEKYEFSLREGIFPILKGL